MSERNKNDVNGDELYLNGDLPEFFHLDDGDDSDVGNYIDGREGKSTVRMVVGLTLPKEKSDWWKRTNS